MPACGICGAKAYTGGLIVLTDFYGRHRRVLACGFCAAWIRARQRPAGAAS